MSREWVDDMKPAPRRGPDTRDRRWVMRCDVRRADDSRCPTEGEPSREQPPLEDYAGAGWFIAKVHGDICPDCLAKGYQPRSEPHPAYSATHAAEVSR
jgi:hypothetical protein